MKKTDIIIEQEMELQILRKQVAELEAWKDSAMQVESEWDCQSVGRALNIPLGQSIRANILPSINALSLQVAQLREAFEDIVSFNPNSSEDTAWQMIGVAKEALNTTPNADEWIKRSELEYLGEIINRPDTYVLVNDHDGERPNGTKLYRIKGETQ